VIAKCGDKVSRYADRNRLRHESDVKLGDELGVIYVISHGKGATANDFHSRFLLVLHSRQPWYQHLSLNCNASDKVVALVRLYHAHSKAKGPFVSFDMMHPPATNTRFVSMAYLQYCSTLIAKDRRSSGYPQRTLAGNKQHVKRPNSACLMQCKRPLFQGSGPDRTLHQKGANLRPILDGCYAVQGETNSRSTLDADLYCGSGY
jgi:hypothetical protein